MIDVYGFKMPFLIILIAVYYLPRGWYYGEIGWVKEIFLENNVA